MLKKTLIAIICATAGLFTAGCSSSKELNEKSARALLREHYAKIHYPIPVSLIAPLMIRTPVSYASVTDALKTAKVKDNVAGYIVQRLVDAKLVKETVETVSYPNIHGNFRKDCCDGALDVYDLTLDSGRITGTRYQTGRASQVDGFVTEAGLVTLSTRDQQGGVSPFANSLEPHQFQYQENDATAHLNSKGGMWVANYLGSPGGTRVQGKMYTYSFSPELKAQVEKTKMPTFGGFGSEEQETFNGGGYDIGEVTDLQLGITPTMASASFAWTASLNKIGKIFYGDDVPKGKGRVTFVRKPDETWTMKDWCVAANCPF